MTHFTASPGVLRPQLYQFAIRTVLAVGDQLRYEVGDVGRVAGGQVDAAARVALRDGLRFLLKQRHLRARLEADSAAGTPDAPAPMTTTS